MLQNLLIDRFRLKFHRQIVERPGFALVVGKNGPKVKQAKGEDVVTNRRARERGRLSRLSHAARRHRLALIQAVLRGRPQRTLVDPRRYRANSFAQRRAASA